MNAIIALCHFCDHHGPTTIFCTQAFKYSNTAAAALLNEEVEIELATSTSLTSTGDPSIPLSSSPSSPPPPQLTNAAPRSVATSPPLPASRSTCRACRAFNKGFHHYISYEKPSIAANTVPAETSDELGASSRICYISQAAPSDPEVFAIVRKACLRTLHCEVFEDPIYFDDDTNGSVIGYEFNIKDCEGRGFQRSYSLIIIMKDRIYLQHLWSFLSKQMATIAANIKAEAERKFERDMQEKGLSSTTSTTTSSEFFSAQNTSHRENIEHAKRRSTTKQSRGLIELCDNEQIFAKLHMWFTWILRMSSSRLTEVLVQAPLPEDSLVARERLRHAAEFKIASFVDHNHHNHHLSNYLNHQSRLFSGGGIEENSSVDHQDSTNFTGSEPSNLSSFYYDAELSQLTVESLRQLIKLIGFEKFHQLAYHTVVGNQVIVRSKYENLVVSIIKCLENNCKSHCNLCKSHKKELIPVGCCKSVYYSNEYIKSYRCKLLGISERVTPFSGSDFGGPITTNINQNNDPTTLTSPLVSPTNTTTTNQAADLNEYVFIDLIGNDHTIMDMAPMTQQKELNNSTSNEVVSGVGVECDGEEDDDTTSTTTSLLDSVIEANKLVVILRTNVSEIQHVPRILKRIETILLNENLDESNISSFIQMAKDEWLNKTKVFYKFAHSPIEKTSESVENILKMLKLDTNDELALKFWQAGLSNECKVQIRKS